MNKLFRKLEKYRLLAQVDAQVRLTLLEKVVAKLLQRQGLDLVVGGPDDLDLVEVDLVGAGAGIPEQGLVGDAVTATEQTADADKLETPTGTTSEPGSGQSVVDGAA